MRTLRAICHITVLLALLATTGCLQIEQILLLRKDGSGTFDVNYTIPNETSERIQAMLRLTREMALAAGDAAPAPAEDDFTRMLFKPKKSEIETLLASYREHGIRVLNLKVENRNAAYEVALKVEFDDIARVAKADFFERYGFSMVRTSKGNYLLYTRPATDEPMDPAWNANNTEALSRLTPFLNGFAFALEVHTPGRVIKTNADSRTSYTAEWEFRFAQDPNAVSELQRKRMTVLFDGTGIEELKDLHQPEPDDAESDTPSS